MEGDIISRQKIAFKAIPAAGVHGVGLLNLPRNLSLLLRGYLKAGEIIRDFRPDVLFFTGGYLAVPAAYAGRSVPSLVYIPDIEPGLAIRAISNLASIIAVTVDRTRLHTPKNKSILLSGYPVRRKMLAWTRESALNALSLDPAVPVLLVFGGSKGARSINKALLKILPELLKDLQIVHITGRLDWDEINHHSRTLSEKEQKKYRVYPYLHEEMGAALRVADLVVSRSGASILGEYPMFGLPAILVPYPHAWRYQETNAAYLADRNAALIINDDDLDSRLLLEIQDLFRDPETLTLMSAAMKSLAKPNAAERIANQLMELAGFNPGGEVR
jgi:UDP-N-acetylglucosamine--N-acetylmuramyl-(pentapeptide) pyrophosphoryl-undecaprenol N-acetylglucosamine transferase